MRVLFYVTCATIVTVLSTALAISLNRTSWKELDKARSAELVWQIDKYKNVEIGKENLSACPATEEASSLLSGYEFSAFNIRKGVYETGIICRYSFSKDNSGALYFALH